jgi:hypothetical protein
MKLMKYVGVVKVITERLASYVSIINFAMVLYLYTRSNPLGLGPMSWALLMLVAIPCIISFDWLVVFPSAMRVSYGKKNPEFQELRNDVIKIKECLMLEE